MKLRTILTVIGLFAVFSVQAQTQVPVFTSGEDGYKTYRIPAIVRLKNNDLLAFCEGRVNGAGDFGDVDIVMKRSTDNGKTWGTLQLLVNYGTLQAGNPAPVVDLADKAYPNGRIFLFYNTGYVHEGEVRKGKGLREVWYISSTDGGNSWSDPVNITTQVHRPKRPDLNPTYNFPEDWRSYANTPGHAMQFEKGKYRGRIFVAANYSAGGPHRDFSDYMAMGFYSDDHGQTFHIANDINIPGSNESTAAELSGNRLMLNSRNQKGDIRARIVSISKDGGASWDTVYFDNNLPDPVNEGAILTIRHGRKNTLAFCNAADTHKRNNLTLRISKDDGMTWTKNILIDKNDGKGDYTAYSDLVKISKNKIGVLYERNNYREILFSVVDWRK